MLVLDGKIITPIITRKTSFYFMGCKLIIKKPRRRYYTKINSSKPMYPYSFESYLGDVQLSCQVKNKLEARKKLAKLLMIDSIGRFSSEGLGKIQWTSGRMPGEIKSKSKLSPRYRKVKIRKGLPHYLPDRIKNLLQYALLHDFFNTDRHPSKIYVEPIFDDSGLIDKLRRHHEKNTRDPLISKFQHYDHLAAIITRKIRSPTTSRYNWRATKKVDYVSIAIRIGEIADHVWKLYTYIYNSKEIDLLNESLQFGHSSLREHLLVASNLIVNDYYKELTKISKC
ncbi:MAG: hypothetical protein ACXAEU_19415 [Candidatus Hodarchaeales archaeon]